MAVSDGNLYIFNEDGEIWKPNLCSLCDGRGSYHGIKCMRCWDTQRLCHVAGAGWGYKNGNFAESRFRLCRSVCGTTLTTGSNKEPRLTVVDYGSRSVRQVNLNTKTVTTLIGRVDDDDNGRRGGLGLLGDRHRSWLRDGDRANATMRWPKGICSITPQMFLMSDEGALRVITLDDEGNHAQIRTIFRHNTGIEGVLFVRGDPFRLGHENGTIFYTSLYQPDDEIELYALEWDNNLIYRPVPEPLAREPVARIQDAGCCTHRNLVFDPYIPAIMLNVDDRIICVRRSEDSGPWSSDSVNVWKQKQNGQAPSERARFGDADTGSFLVYDPATDCYFYTTNTKLYRLHVTMCG